MYRSAKVIIPYAFLMFGCFSALAQRIENLKTTLNEDNIEITFDLIDDKGDQTFDLLFYSSHDNYASPLINITGDAGEEVTPGTGKKAIWEAKKELGAYKGEIYIELRGIVTPPFVRILSPKAGDKFKPGKQIDIEWDTQISGDMTIDLYHDGEKVSTITRSVTSGEFNLEKDLTKGGGYYLVFSNTNKPGKTVVSDQFVLSGGTPTWLLVAGVAVVGGVVGTVLSAGQADPQPNPEDEDIPDPIKPGGN